MTKHDEHKTCILMEIPDKIRRIIIAFLLILLIECISYIGWRKII